MDNYLYLENRTDRHVHVGTYEVNAISFAPMTDGRLQITSGGETTYIDPGLWRTIDAEPGIYPMASSVGMKLISKIPSELKDSYLEQAESKLTGGRVIKTTNNQGHSCIKQTVDIPNARQNIQVFCEIALTQEGLPYTRSGVCIDGKAVFCEHLAKDAMPAITHHKNNHDNLIERLSRDCLIETALLKTRIVRNQLPAQALNPSTLELTNYQKFGANNGHSLHEIKRIENWESAKQEHTLSMEH